MDNNNLTAIGSAKAEEEKKTSDVETLKEKYKRIGEKVYLVNTSVMVDDDTEEEYGFLFAKPKTASFDRYVKTVSASNTKAAHAFIQDNIIPEQKAEVLETLKEYPAMAISITDKLLKMLGLADFTSVKKL